MPTHEIIKPKSQLPVYFDIYHAFNQLIPSHWHNHLEVLYIFRGTMHIGRNDEKYTLHENDLFIINSGYIHFTRCPGNVEVLLLQIPQELLQNSSVQHKPLYFREYHPNLELKDDPSHQRMIQQLMAMKHLYEEKKDGYQFLFNSHLSLFIHDLYCYYLLPQNPADNIKVAKHLERLQVIIDYVAQHYSEAISLSKIASLVSLNPEYFCRSFKKYTGFTFMEYVNFVRLTHIHKDILDSDDSITCIQERHGFINYKVFNRMFKETYGCTPSKLKFKAFGP